ncbi:DNA damage-inducible protein 1 [Tanacetum coccineum]
MHSVVPLQQQQLLYNGNEMRSNETLSGLGVADGDLMVTVSNASSAPSERCSHKEGAMDSSSSSEEDEFPSIESVSPQSMIDTTYQSKTEKVMVASSSGEEKHSNFALDWYVVVYG